MTENTVRDFIGMVLIVMAVCLMAGCTEAGTQATAILEPETSPSAAWQLYFEYSEMPAESGGGRPR